VEDLHEVVDIEDEPDEDTPTPLFYDRVLSDKEKRKMERVKADADKAADKKTKRLEKEAAKAKKEKRRLRTAISSLRPEFEMSASAEG
jgi:hypothetical protein